MIDLPRRKGRACASYQNTSIFRFDCFWLFGFEPGGWVWKSRDRKVRIWFSPRKLADEMGVGDWECRRLEFRAPIQVHRAALFRETHPCASGPARTGKMNLNAGQLMAFKSTLEWILCGFFFVGETTSSLPRSLPANRAPCGPLGTP